MGNEVAEQGRTLEERAQSLDAIRVLAVSGQDADNHVRAARRMLDSGDWQRAVDQLKLDRETQDNEL